MPSWVIVGASRGIGYQYLKTLSQDPNNTIIGLVRTPGPTEEKVAADKLSNVHIHQGDLTDPASLAAAAKFTASITGDAVDYLIVNGAYLSEHTLFMNPLDYIGKEDIFLEELEKSMSANVAGVLNSVNAFLPLVKKSSIKKIIVITTGHADIDVVQTAKVSAAVPYAISKVSANLLVSKYAVALEGEGVVFLSISPGVVLTQTSDLAHAPPEVQAAYERMGTQFRKLKPDFKGPMMPEESVEKMLKVIDGITLKDSGAFLSHHGNKQWL